MRNEIKRAEAFKLAPDYVRFIEGDFDLFEAVETKFQKLKRGQACLTYRDNNFIKCKVSQVSHNDPRALDGPLVRVADHEGSWRVDGDKYAYPIE